MPSVTSASIPPQERVKAYTDTPLLDPRGERWWDDDSIPEILRSKNYPAVERQMLFGDNEDGESFTFRAQIDEAVRSNPHPLTFFLTANSAIPIADTLRGYYNELGLCYPGIFYIEANKLMVRHALDMEEDGKIQPCLTEEIDRLTSIAKENLIERACVIDQFVATGRSLKLATWMLKCAGVPNITSMPGNWYHDAHPRNIDKDNMTSTHANKMHEIGVRACRLAG